MTRERREEINRAMRGEVRGLYISDDVREIIGDLTAALAWAERDRDGLKARLMSDQVKACVAVLEGLTGADPPDLQELARSAKIYAGQYKAERDEARAAKVNTEGVLEEISSILDRYWGRT